MAGGGKSCSGYEHVQANTSLMMLKRALGAAPALLVTGCHSFLAHEISALQGFPLAPVCILKVNSRNSSIL